MGKEKWLRGETSGNDQLNGLLDKGCAFEGKLQFQGAVQINGEFRGDITSSGTLMVGPDAHLKAKIAVDTLIIDGCVEGEVAATGKIELHAHGRLIANITTKSFVIEEGGIFHGLCQAPDLVSEDRSDASKGRLYVAAENASPEAANE